MDPTAQPVSPPAHESTAFKGSGLALGISLLLLATIAVVLRFVARAKKHVGIALDDWLIVLSLLFYAAVTGVAIWNVLAGDYNLDIRTLPLPVLELTLKAFYINAILVVPTITFAKLSVLCLFHKIFVTPAFRRWVVIIGISCILWCVSAVAAIIPRCNPIKSAWDLSVPGKCYDFALFVVIIETFNCLQDAIIVFMPWTVIRHLQMPRRQRISISLIFVLGGFVIITSIVRITYTWRPEDPGKAVLNTGKWALLQLSSAIICACLPTYGVFLPQDLGPLDRLWTRWRASGSRLVGRSSDPKSQGQSSSRPHAVGYNGLEDHARGEVMSSARAGSGANSSERELAYKTFPMESISVTHTVHIV